MPRLLISAAHTMENPGQIFQDLKEADLTRKILKKAIPYLEETNIEFQAVPLDLPLLQRIDWINATDYTEEQGDILIEIHINDGGKRGVEGWYKGATDTSNESEKLTVSILNSICKYTKYENQGAKSEYDHELGSLLILNTVNCIATAIESLYIDNTEDIVLLKDDKKLDELAKALVDSIKDYFKEKENPPVKKEELRSDDKQVLSLTQSLNIDKTDNIDTPSKSQEPLNKESAISNSNPLIKKPISNFNDLLTPNSSSGGFDASSAFGGFGGMGNGSNPLFGAGGTKPFGSFGSNTSSTSQNKNTPVLDREERKKMIEETYKKLGLEIKQNDLNFYLNTGINKQDLLEKLLADPLYIKMIEDSKEVPELKRKLQDIEMKTSQLEVNKNDLESMLAILNSSLLLKNTLIASLQKRLTSNGILLEGQKLDSLHDKNQEAKVIPNSLNQTKKKFNIVTIIMRIFKV